jgi:hypothetical protein
MSSINTYINANNNNTMTLLQKALKQEDSKLEAYILRKQISMSCFMPNVSTITMEKPSFIPTMKSNLKSQVEELQKLQSEVNYMENKVRELEMNKRAKQTKV